MIKVIHHMCQPWLYKKSRCRRCIEACPVEDCIRFEGDSVSVDDEKCIGCGICTNACPSGALVFEELSDGELWNRLNAGTEAGGIHFGCTLRPEDTPPAATTGTLEPGQATHLNLPCLAILKEAHLAALILKGVEKIYLDMTGCTTCSLGQGKKAIEASVAHARAIVDKAGCEGRIELVYEPPTDGARGGKGGKKKSAKAKQIVAAPEYSRRELFTFLKDKAGEKAAEKVLGPKSTENETEEVDLEKLMPEARALLVGALNEMDPRPAARLAEGTFPVHNVGVRDTCTMCGRCDVFCPTGALESVEGKGEVALEFRMDRCVGCHDCKELCPEGAIYYHPEIELERFVEEGAEQLVKMQSLKCPKCRNTFFPELHPDGCPRCKKLNKMDNLIGRTLYGQGWDKDKTVFGKDIN